MSKLISMAAAATGNLPRVILQMKLAQLQLIKDSQASKWGKPFLLPVGRKSKRCQNQ
jgi:hypothetical protein